MKAKATPQVGRCLYTPTPTAPITVQAETDSDSHESGEWQVWPAFLVADLVNNRHQEYEERQASNLNWSFSK